MTLLALLLLALTPHRVVVEPADPASADLLVANCLALPAPLEAVTEHAAADLVMRVTTATPAVPTHPVGYTPTYFRPFEPDDGRRTYFRHRAIVSLVTPTGTVLWTAEVKRTPHEAPCALAAKLLTKARRAPPLAR